MREREFVVVGAICTILGLVISAQATTVELINNGNFGSLSLTGWTQIDPDPSTSSMEWGVTSGGSVGAEHIHSSDWSSFATPWEKGPNPSSTTIGQKVDLTPYLGSIANNQLHLSADMIYSKDGIEANVKYYDSSDSVISTEFLASMSAFYSGAYNYALDTDLTLPANTVSVEVLFTGHLYDGTWIDAGFDNVSLTAETVPEPITIGLLILGAGLLRRRQRH